MRAVAPLLLISAMACGSAQRSTPAAAPPPAPREAAVRAPAAPAPADPLAREATAVVDRQHDAYNRHDVEAFLGLYADSVAVQTLGDSVVLRGKDRLRRSTEAWFADAPNARTAVVDRMVLGPFVVDRQQVTGGLEGAPVEAIGIYEVREGLIRRVWSIPPAPTPR